MRTVDRLCCGRGFRERRPKIAAAANGEMQADAPRLVNEREAGSGETEKPENVEPQNAKGKRSE